MGERAAAFLFFKRGGAAAKEGNGFMVFYERGFFLGLAFFFLKITPL